MVNRTIYVLLGAGASFDSATTGYIASEPWRPPLVTELFSPRFNGVLSGYPMVRNAAPEILHATTLREPAQLGLEDFLRTAFRDSSDTDDRRVFVGVPLYLQDLLLRVSTAWAIAPSSYQLLDGLLRRHFDEVIYITLNYDILLDSVLAARRPLEVFDDYVSSETRWALIKPHGSITWGRRIIQDGAMTGWRFHDPPAEFEQDEALDHSWTTDLTGLRRRSGTSREGSYYPAISVPLGPGIKSFNCPSVHLEWLAARLAAADAIDLLTIGYSGTDRDVLDLIAEHGGDVRSALVIAQDVVSAKDAFARVSDVLGFGLDVAHQVGGAGFAEMLESADFVDWITRVGKGERVGTFLESTRQALGVL